MFLSIISLFILQKKKKMGNQNWSFLHVALNTQVRHDCLIMSLMNNPFHMPKK